MARFPRLIALAALLVASRPVAAQTVTANFENLALAPQTYRDGLSLSGSFMSGGATFRAPVNTDFPGFEYGYGFAYSNVIDTTTAGFTNQFAAYSTSTGPGAGSNGSANYAVAFQDSFAPDGTPTVALPTGHLATTVELNNTTYAALSILNGDSFSKKFGGASGNDPDWFKVTIAGHNSLNQSTGSIDFYLADYRFTNNAQDYIVKDWTSIDLSGLSDDTATLSFSLSSSDTGVFGMNTPAYFALDNLTLSPVPEPLLTGLLGAMGLAAWRRSRRTRSVSAGVAAFCLRFLLSGRTLESSRSRAGRGSLRYQFWCCRARCRT